MFFRNKRKMVVEERTVDSKPFEIPQIKDESMTKTYQRDHFVSPIFGTFVKDEIVIPEDSRAIVMITIIGGIKLPEKGNMETKIDVGWGKQTEDFQVNLNMADLSEAKTPFNPTTTK